MISIEFKKAERDRKKKALEAEFAGIFAEIARKKEYLDSFESKIADMESNRQRKEREFKRLQRNLMELLSEQKRELDNIREKGIELEIATAESAAAASATAIKAKEHEKQTEAIFSNTEELMKFQFMSMGLTYFSAMNMLQGLRDINSDTTSSAISTSAETAVAAAAASAAANIPSMKKLDLGAGELLSAIEEKEKVKAQEKKKQLEEDKKILSEPFPLDIDDWTVDDICRWLKSLSLGQYIKAFREACVDGEFLMELTPDDLKDVLGVEHALHIKKILFARDKLRRDKKLSSPSSRPNSHRVSNIKLQNKSFDSSERNSLISDTNTLSKTEVLEDNEETQNREYDKDTVFNWCNQGRSKKVEEAINNGFNINTVDINGNSMLIISCENVDRQMVEMLLTHKCDIDYKNRDGNTALHFAMSNDPTVYL